MISKVVVVLAMVVFAKNSVVGVGVVVASLGAITPCVVLPDGMKVGDAVFVVSVVVV